MNAKAYVVHAKHWAKGWELHIDSVGVTQSRTLDTAEGMVREYLSLALNVAESDVAVDMRIDVDSTVMADIKRARALQPRIAEEQADVAGLLRRAVAALRAERYSVSDIASILGVSRGRVSALV